MGGSRGTALSALLAVLVLSFAVDVVRGQDSSWIQMGPPSAPSFRLGHAMAYESESDRVILFGGEAAPLSNVLNDETWAYDLNSNTWENRNPNQRPSARFAHAMAYDVESDRVILFGGWTGTDQSPETWAYDYNTNTWTNMTDTTSPPSGVFAHMAYDTESDRIVLFGGVTDRSLGGVSGETWAYDFDSNTWTRMNPGNSPSPRQIYGMIAYDAGSDRIVLFGGLGAGGSLADTWAYSYNGDTWTQMTPGNSPSARHAGVMAYDASADRVILFGGNANGGSDETWIYDTQSDTWTLAGKGTGPSPRFGAAMAYDAESEIIVLSGGSSGGDQTWSHRFVSPPSPLWIYVAVGVAIASAGGIVAVLLIRRSRRRRKVAP